MNYDAAHGAMNESQILGTSNLARTVLNHVVSCATQIISRNLPHKVLPFQEIACFPGQPLENEVIQRRIGKISMDIMDLCNSYSQTCFIITLSKRIPTPFRRNWILAVGQAHHLPSQS